MKPRQLAVMGAVAVVLVALIFLTGKDDDKQRLQQIAPTTDQTEFFKGVDPANIARIRLERTGTNPVVLVRTAGTSWTMETKRGPRALKRRVEEALLGPREAPEIRPGIKALRQSERAESQESFGTDPQNGTLATFMDEKGTVLEKFVLGRRNRNATATCFVRRPDSDSTFLLDVDISDNFRYDKPTDFLETFLFPKTQAADFDDIRVEIEAPTSHTVILRRVAGSAPEQGEWDYEIDGEKGRTQGPNANRYASTISSLMIVQHAEDLPDEAQSFEPIAKATFRRKGFEEPITMEIGQPEEGAKWILIRLSTHPDVVGAAGAWHLLRDPTLLKPFDPEAMTGGVPSE